MSFNQYKAKKGQKGDNAAGAVLERPRQQNYNCLLLYRAVSESLAEAAAVFESLGIFEHFFQAGIVAVTFDLLDLCVKITDLCLVRCFFLKFCPYLSVDLSYLFHLCSVFRREFSSGTFCRSSEL